jgi:predicted short-subunit dehydrogenase-like oxidoreductase (DUF2520 family)
MAIASDRPIAQNSALSPPVARGTGIAGIVHHLRAMKALTSPNVNYYPIIGVVRSAG